jgi:hypothetical protein
MAISPKPDYTVTKQEFLNTIINKIGKQTYTDQAYINPLKRFKGEFIENATDIEEIYVAPASDTGYDKEGTGVLDRKKPVTYAQYHTDTKEHGYAVTQNDKEVRKAFHTKEGVSRLADHIIQSLHNGDNIQEYNDVIEVIKALANAKTVNNTITVSKVVDETTAKNFCKEVKKVIPKMAEFNSLYSAKPNFAPKERLVLFIDSDVDVEVSTEYLASLFNMTVAELNDTTKILIPNLVTKLGGGQFAILCDERCLKIHPTYYNIESIRNTRGKFTNYDLVVELLVSYTDWFQFVVFVESVA